MKATLILIGALALASCTALQAQAGPYDGEYRQNQQPWDSYSGSNGDKRREQDERAGYPGSTDPAYDQARERHHRREAEEQRYQDQRQAQEDQARRQRQADQQKIWGY